MLFRASSVCGLEETVGVKYDMALVQVFKSSKIILISLPANKHVCLKETSTLVHTWDVHAN